jgi:hypothetical protein
MFASESQLKEIQEWAEHNKHLFRPNGKGRQFGIFSELSYPSAALELRNKIIDEFGLEGKQQEPLFKDYCGYITEGGAIHEHSDPNKDGLIHTRFNVLISKPVSGGVPIQNGKEIEVEEGDVWRCDAGIVKHWCTEVVGDKPRIVCSFGFLL